MTKGKVFKSVGLGGWGIFLLILVYNLAALLTFGRITVPIPDTLDLPSALAYALENNFSIRQAQQRIREQEGLVVEIRSQALPNVSVEADFFQLDSDLSENFGGLFDRNTENWNIALRVRQALYKGGAMKASLRFQELVEEAVLYDLKATINLAVLDVKIRFYDVLLARERIAVQEENVKLLEEQIENAKNRLEAGTVSQFEVLRAVVERANAQPELIRARNDFRIAIEELRKSLGFVESPGDLESVPEFDGSLVYEPIEWELRTALDIAKVNRPELRQLELVVQAREQGIVIERAEKLPDVDLVGSFQINKSAVSNSFSNALKGWALGVQSSWAIWDGKETDGRIRQAQSQLEQARLDLGEATLEVEVEVRRALHDLQEADELAKASSLVIDQAVESLRLANERYATGGGTQLDVLQSQVALTESRLNQVEAYHSYKVAEAGLAKALGNAIPFAETSD
ncbi:MAG: TolC family protein [Opitutae bacterium]|nr:TolC family protein [Opitutae bacterium]